MSDSRLSDSANSEKKIWFPGGRIYFTRDTERRFFLIMTVAMAVLGIAVRFGWMD